MWPFIFLEVELAQEVSLMKQTGLLCFADEPENPFVTSVLASFEQVLF